MAAAAAAAAASSLVTVGGDDTRSVDVGGRQLLSLSTTEDGCWQWKEAPVAAALWTHNRSTVVCLWVCVSLSLCLCVFVSLCLSGSTSAADGCCR